MNWIYILQCEDGYYYVGQTSRLYTRFWEHSSGGGGINTRVHVPECIVAIYPVHRLGRFFDICNRVITNNGKLQRGDSIYFNRIGLCSIMDIFNNAPIDDESEYDKYEVENTLTECLMLHTNDYIRIKGGKYIRMDDDTHFNMTLGLKNNMINYLPFCKCGLPCDVKREHNHLFFRCAKKNMWSDMKDNFNTIVVDSSQCDFEKIYEDGIDYITAYKTKITELKDQIFKLTRRSRWLEKLEGGTYELCVGGCGKLYNGSNTVRYNGSSINLCFTCFIEKNDELSKKYGDGCIHEKCLIDMSLLTTPV